jgi:tetratricopeptide (TPR) repeat protein
MNRNNRHLLNSPSTNLIGQSQKSGFAIFCLVICFGLISACQSVAPNPQDISAWRGNMKTLVNSLSKVLPAYITYEDEISLDERVALSKDLDILVETAQKVRDSHRPNHDPSLIFFSEKFYDDLEHAKGELKNGNYRSSRHLVLASVNYCIQCHSRTTTQATDFPPLEARWGEPVSLTQAKYYLALRDFKKSLQIYEALLAQPPKSLNAHSIHREIVLPALAIAIRIRRSQAMALKIITKAEANFSYRAAYKYQIKIWRDSLSQWPALNDSAIEGTALAKKAQLLWKQGERISQSKGPEAGLIFWLGASADAHKYLENEAHLPRAAVAEMLYLLGQIEEKISLSGIIDLREYYYERCIQTHPHSQVALQCLYSYKTALKKNPHSVVPNSYLNKRLRLLESLAQIGTRENPIGVPHPLSPTKSSPSPDY